MFVFTENMACFVFLLPPFWDSPFCLITDELAFQFNPFQSSVKFHIDPSHLIFTTNQIIVFYIKCNGLKWVAHLVQMFLFVHYFPVFSRAAHKLMKNPVKPLMELFCENSYRLKHEKMFGWILNAPLNT